MDEQDNDFKELWANLLGKGKKKSGDTEAAKRAQKRSKNTAAKSRVRRGKAAAKSQNHHLFPSAKQKSLLQDLGPRIQTLGHKADSDTVACSSGDTSEGDGSRSPFPASQLSSTASDCSQGTLTGESTKTENTLTDKSGALHLEKTNSSTVEEVYVFPFALSYVGLSRRLTQQCAMYR